MLFHLNVDIDYRALGDRKDEILKAEWARTQELIGSGIAIGEWRKASGNGVVAIWDCASREVLENILQTLPLRPYLTQIDVMPLVPHPLWPDGRTKLRS
jgi:muconolactone delta-isomerase